MLKKDPKLVFAKAKNIIVENMAFIQHFTAQCKKHSDISDQKKMKRLADAIYEIVIKKVVHSRFGAPFQRFNRIGGKSV